MTYNVFGGTLSIAQSINHMIKLCELQTTRWKIANRAFFVSAPFAWNRY